MKLEETIRQRRDELDIDLPSPRVWKGVQQQLRPTVNRYARYRWWAAAAILVLTMGAGLAICNRQDTGNTLAATPVLQPIPILSQQAVAAPASPAPAPRDIARQKSSQLQWQNPGAGKPLPVRQKQLPRPSPAVSPVDSFYNASISLLKDRINSTPVKWVEQDFFGVYLDRYKSLEKEEQAMKKQWNNRVSDDDFMRDLINLSRRKLNVLETLYMQMQNINSKKGDTARKQTNRIII